MKTLEQQRRYNREYARAHYRPRRRRSLWERVWSGIEITPTCWLWTRSLGHGGRYGAVVADGKSKAVHRILYELLRGPVPEGLELDHLCRNTQCVRPDHLEAVTHLENMRRGIQASRQECKNGHPLTLTNFGRICRICRREHNKAYRRRHGLVKAA
jgi:hypothetical protein